MGVYVERIKLEAVVAEAESESVIKTYTNFTRTLQPNENGYFKEITSECIFSIGYGSYNGVRRMLAETYDIEQHHETDEPLNLIVFFSDCEGYIGPTATKIMSDFLKLPENEEKLEAYIAKESVYESNEWYLSCLVHLVAGIIKAGENGEYLHFT